MTSETGNQGRKRCVTQWRSAPHQAWICGYAELGKCCQSGPTADGLCCRAVTAHDSATDNQGENDNDEPLSHDLPPCIPRRSHRFRRQSLCVNLAILTGGVLLLIMSLPSREKVFVPGDLSSKHAQILDNTLVSQRCGLCHPASHGDNDLLSAFKGQLRLNDAQQDALCMQCHKGHMPDAAQRLPHDLSNAMWQTLADRRATSQPWRPVSTSNSEPQTSQHLKQTNCASCHIEHHGRDFDLKKLADDSCQACHRKQFDSLSSGHPEFANFPAERPRALAFSHRAHADKHFPQKSRDFDCRQCHVDTQRLAGNEPVTRSVSFETACASCHDEPIRAASADGWALLQLPSIELPAAETDADLVHWPVEARFGFEGFVSPVLRGLLAADAEVAATLNQIPISGQLSEITSLDEREHVTKNLARAVRSLIADTAREGQAAWRSRLETVTRAQLGRDLSDNDRQLINAMCAGLPPDLFRKMESQWFNGAERLVNHADVTAGDHMAPHKPLSRADRRMVLVSDADDSLLNSSELAADNSLMETNSALADPSDDSLLNSDDSLLLQGPENEDAALDNSAASDASEGLLNIESSRASSLDDALLPSTEELDAIDTKHVRASTNDRPLQGSKLKPLKGATHVTASGWYIDEQTLALKYMPSGHADATLAAWTMWWSLMASANKFNLTTETSEQLALAMAKQLPGGCVECHRLDGRALIDSSPSWTLMSAWQVHDASPQRKEFTKFNHTPHLSLPAVNDCRYCHVLPPAPDASSKSVRPRLVSMQAAMSEQGHGSEFQKMHLAQCVACHRPNGANAGCLQCHNYHINALPSP